MRLRALIAWIAFAVLAFLCIHAPEPQNAGLPIVQSALNTALPICPRFEAHPCSRVNCQRIIA